VNDALAAGITVRGACAIDRIVEQGALAGDELLPADAIAVCAGAWATQLVPDLTGSLRAVGQPVFHLQPAERAPFEAARFPVFGADISRTGYYGFPVNRDGIVKIANHGTGIELAPDAPRNVTAAQEAALRDFLRESFPALADAPLVGRRLCVYGDTRDAHFWIARHPQRPNLTVATGGSGHGFKFAPVLGELIADAVLGRANRFTHKFRWRTDLAAPWSGDAARSS
jgi:glycine/D-amino acid oxidase-like deaminating enzyme